MKASWKARISENLRFWRPTWRQVGTKIDAEIDVIFERQFFEKTSFFIMKSFFEIQGVEVRTKNRLKIDAKKDEILKRSWKARISENLRFWKATWRQVGTKIEAEIDVIFERRFF